MLQNQSSCIKLKGNIYVSVSCYVVNLCGCEILRNISWCKKCLQYRNINHESFFPNTCWLFYWYQYVRWFVVICSDMRFIQVLRCSYTITLNKHFHLYNRKEIFDKLILVFKISCWSRAQVQYFLGQTSKNIQTAGPTGWTFSERIWSEMEQ